MLKSTHLTSDDLQSHVFLNKELYRGEFVNIDVLEQRIIEAEVNYAKLTDPSFADLTRFMSEQMEQIYLFCQRREFCEKGDMQATSDESTFFLNNKSKLDELSDRVRVIVDQMHAQFEANRKDGASLMPNFLSEILEPTSKTKMSVTQKEPGVSFAKKGFFNRNANTSKPKVATVITASSDNEEKADEGISFMHGKKGFLSK